MPFNQNQVAEDRELEKTIYKNAVRELVSFLNKNVKVEESSNESEVEEKSIEKKELKIVKHNAFALSKRKSDKLRRDEDKGPNSKIASNSKKVKFNDVVETIPIKKNEATLRRCKMDVRHLLHKQKHDNGGVSEQEPKARTVNQSGKTASTAKGRDSGRTDGLKKKGRINKYTVVGKKMEKRRIQAEAEGKTVEEVIKANIEKNKGSKSKKSRQIVMKYETGKNPRYVRDFESRTKQGTKGKKQMRGDARSKIRRKMK